MAITVGGTMDAKGRVGVRTSPRWSVALGGVCGSWCWSCVVAALAIPLNAASASAPSAAASGPVVKVGMIYVADGPARLEPRR